MWSQPYWTYQFHNICDYHNYQSFRSKTFTLPQGEFVDDGTETHFTLGDHDCCIKAVSSGKRRDGIIHTLLMDGMEISESEWSVWMSVWVCLNYPSSRKVCTVYMEVGTACAHLWPQISLCWFSNGLFWDKCVLQTHSLVILLYTSHSVSGYLF